MSCIEELAGSYFQIFADFQEVLHGRQGAPGRNGLDVTFVFAEPITVLLSRGSRAMEE